MARPTLPDELKIKRGTYRPGRANAPTPGLCEGASRRIQTAKLLLDPASLDVYAEAVELIEAATPHIDGKHGMPDAESLKAIEILEGAVMALLDSIDADAHTRDALALKGSQLYRLILDAQARAA